MEWRKSRRTLCICYSSDDEKQKEARVFGAIGRHVPAAKRPMDSYYAAKTFFRGKIETENLNFQRSPVKISGNNRDEIRPSHLTNIVYISIRLTWQLGLGLV